MTPRELKKLRETLGWNKTQMAELCYVTKWQYFKWEKGHIAPGRMAQKRLQEIRNNVELFKSPLATVRANTKLPTVDE